MALREKGFSPEAAVEALLYVLHRVGRPATVHELLKIRYFADKEHLSMYGGLASGDRYYAMEFGPVASGTYDLLKVAGKRAKNVPPRFVELATDALDGSDYPKVRAKREPNMEFLSQSKVDALDDAIEKCRGWDFTKRVKESHDSAWDTARARWAETGDATMSVPLISQALSNADEVLAHLAA
ncbi:Panacea domain-containing protein [Roseateles toxinivorans]|uniref:Uncharacterized protein DUF4065 n=1 Tax=Roseateles toxinivorans TaxID=270368 RepID=A0A4R6QKQ9_9BURK|nr:Panacea domain-containing protein [Roseateles toxinivorans]TDP63149.1 uncharacterized protein DUF4065 [Roseateles toxinivorans]